MKPSTKIAGLSAACAACCALPSVAGLSLATASADMIGGGLLAAALAVGGTMALVKRTRVGGDDVPSRWQLRLPRGGKGMGAVDQAFAGQMLSEEPRAGNGQETSRQPRRRGFLIRRCGRMRDLVCCRWRCRRSYSPASAGCWRGSRARISGSPSSPSWPSLQLGCGSGGRAGAPARGRRGARSTCWLPRPCFWAWR